MRIAVTGSIATDHLMTYPGRFIDHLIDNQLHKVSLSFLADTLEVRRGGVAANIALGLARLGLTPVLVGAVGKDFAEYGAWLGAQGVDTRSVYVSESLHTARFVCTTDLDHNQLATFYAGAMAEARRIHLTEVQERSGKPDLVVVAPNDPAAMLSLTDECRRRGVPFAADPSQQLARLQPAEVKLLVDGARFLFTNEYEAALLQERTGWPEEQLVQRVGAWIITCGAEGAKILRAGESALHVKAAPTHAAVDPTGVGDAFRSGFLAGTAMGLSDVYAAQLGCVLATIVLEVVGTQGYEIARAGLLSRAEEAYGPVAAQQIGPCLRAFPR
ncbi:carbohydrate kinase family protein [Streptomyces sp. NPDC006356]